MAHFPWVVVYLNTRHASECFKMLKPIAELEQLEPDNTDTYMSNLIDYYHGRTDENGQMCLYIFAAWYERLGRGRKSPYTPDVYIKGYDIWFRKLGKFPQMHYLKFAMHNKEYYYSLLMLQPNRKEAELLAPHETAANAFDQKEDLMDKSMITHFSFAADIDATISLGLCTFGMN